MTDWKRAVARVYKGIRGEGGEFCGTAFMVSDRWLLTCWHVARNVQEKDIRLYDVAAWCGGLRRVRRIIADEQVDVALLELSESTDKASIIPCEEQISVAGKQVDCAGFSSEGGDLDCFSVQISSYRGENNLYVFLGPIGKGMSGGPVLYQGELVGIARLQDNNKTYLIPLSDFQNLLNQYIFFDSTERLLKETAMSLSRSVYISYSWKAEDKNDTVEKLLAAFDNQGIEVKRDIKEIGYGAPIKAYMDELAAGGAIILVLSDPYFKSPNCMYELREIYRNNRKDFRKLIFPVVMQDTHFHRAIDRIPYISFWQEETKNLEQALGTVDIKNIGPSHQELLDYADFSRIIDKLQFMIADMNHLSEEEHLKADFSSLIERVVDVYPFSSSGLKLKGNSSSNIPPKEELRSEEISEVEKLLEYTNSPHVRESLERRLNKLKSQ